MKNTPERKQISDYFTTNDRKLPKITLKRQGLGKFLMSN